MFSKNRFSLFIIVFVLLVMIAMGVDVKADESHDVKNPHLSFTSLPKISCNIDGWFFHHKRTTMYGKVIEDFWWKEPQAPVFKIEAEAHGWGWAHITLSGNYDGKTFSKTEDQKLGKWLGIAPVGFGVDHTVGTEEIGTFNRNPKVYPWDAKGSIKLVPYIWKWRMTGIIPGGEWQPAPDGFNRKEKAKADGSWTVTRKWQEEDSNDEDDEDDDNNGNNGGNNGNNGGGNDGNNGGNNDDVTIIGGDDTKPRTPLTPPPTVPDSPSNFTATPGRIAIKLLWDAPSSDGGSPITDYQYQYKRKQTATSWTAWSGWTSVGTREYEWITGLRANRRYWVRIRALNSIGASSNTGTIVDTRR